MKVSYGEMMIFQKTNIIFIMTPSAICQKLRNSLLDPLSAILLCFKLSGRRKSISEEDDRACNVLDNTPGSGFLLSQLKIKVEINPAETHTGKTLTTFRPSHPSSTNCYKMSYVLWCCSVTYLLQPPTLDMHSCIAWGKYLPEWWRRAMHSPLQ